MQELSNRIGFECIREQVDSSFLWNKEAQGVSIDNVLTRVIAEQTYYGSKLWAQAPEVMLICFLQFCLSHGHFCVPVFLLFWLLTTRTKKWVFFVLYRVKDYVYIFNTKI